MAIRRDVREQNAATREGIRSVASAFRNDMPRYPWLLSALSARRLDPNSGILVQLEWIPEQDGDLYQGYWLSADRRFYYFEIVAPRTPRTWARVEQWRDATDDVQVEERQPGTGKSFGIVALEVLSEWSGNQASDSGPKQERPR